MSLLAEASYGIQHGPQYNIIAGEHGLGKSTLASQFDKPMFADLENGSKNLSVHRFGPNKLPDYQAYLKFVDRIRHTTDDIKSFTTDSLTKIESYIHRHLCGSKYETIEDYAGGFGKGFTAAREMANELNEKFIDIVENREIDVNVVAHVQVKKQCDPYDNTEYDRYILQGHEKFTQIFYSQAYNVYFMKRVVFTELNKNKKTIASFDGQRMLVTEWRPGANAKNRLGLPAEILLPADKDKAYETLRKAIEEAKVTPEQLRADITALIERTDAETATKAKERMADAGDSVDKLLFIKSKVMEKVTV